MPRHAEPPCRSAAGRRLICVVKALQACSFLHTSYLAAHAKSHVIDSIIFSV